MFAIHDTADEKRRQVLERLFFHDVLNTAGGLSGLLDILPELDKEEAVEVGHEAHFLAEQLIEEIQSQRDLAAAERGDLKVTSGVIDAVDLLRRLSILYRHHSVAQGKTMVVREGAQRVVLQSDARLLARVLGNLIKNALEASKKDETVTVWVENGAAPAFHVHNEAAMPEEVQAQMFQRSFSTKGGVGRGVGTYSVKLLTQNYLRGTVEFHSSAAAGTMFTVRLPPRLDVGPDGAR
ncbi:MAG: sensor histidine kinase [Candidatus Binatia bacterium]